MSGKLIFEISIKWRIQVFFQPYIRYTGLWRVLVEQASIDEALFVIEK